MWTWPRKKKINKTRNEWQRKTIAEKLMDTCELKHYVMDFSLIRGYHQPLRSLPLRLASCCTLITALSGRNANYSKKKKKKSPQTLTMPLLWHDNHRQQNAVNTLPRGQYFNEEQWIVAELMLLSQTRPKRRFKFKRLLWR